MKRVAEEEKRRMIDEVRCAKDDLANLTSELELANESKKEHRRRVMDLVAKKKKEIGKKVAAVRKRQEDEPAAVFPDHAPSKEEVATVGGPRPPSRPPTQVARWLQRTPSPAADRQRHRNAKGGKGRGKAQDALNKKGFRLVPRSKGRSGPPDARRVTIQRD